MSLTVIVGGQFGGEGKGLATAALARTLPADILVKTGGPNCSHSYVAAGRRYQLRMVPSGADLHPRAVVYPAGVLIHVPTLLRELAEVGFHGDVVVDPLAGIVDYEHIAQQKADTFYDSTGSTRTGTGAATAMRSLRRLKLARDDAALQPFLRDAAPFLADELRLQRRVLVEGSQGYGLSNYHGTYPYVTSRDSTAPAFLSQLGLGHQWLSAVVLVVKCLPTRNSGGSGQLIDEIPSELIDSIGDAVSEYGGGSYDDPGLRRRVGLFDFTLLERAVTANTPTALFVTGFDRLQSALANDHVRARYQTIEHFRELVEQTAKLPIAYEGWGEEIESVREIWR